MRQWSHFASNIWAMRFFESSGLMFSGLGAVRSTGPPKYEGKWSNEKNGNEHSEFKIQKVGDAYFIDEKYRGRIFLNLDQDGTLNSINYGTWMIYPKSDTLITPDGVFHHIN